MEARTPILLVQHQRESYKTTNTARIASLALPGVQLVTYGAPEEPLDPSWFAQEGQALLFPAEEGVPLWDTSRLPSRLVVLDGTWNHARRLARRHRALWTMPRVSLSLSPAARLRASPHEEGGSTLEAIAAALTVFDGEEVGRALLALHAQYVARVLYARGQR